MLEPMELGLRDIGAVSRERLTTNFSIALQGVAWICEVKREAAFSPIFLVRAWLKITVWLQSIDNSRTLM